MAMTIQQQSPSRPASSSSRFSTSPTSPIDARSWHSRSSFSHPGSSSNNNNFDLVARMQAKQEAWNAIAAQSRSSTSDASDRSTSGSPLAVSMTPIKAGESSVMGAKAERNGNGTSSSTSLSNGNDGKSGKAGPSKKRREKGEGKRKKVAKACLACQKSHLTCDEQRPCTRCVKKGMQDQCVEGVRKKAKYLLEGEERDAVPQPGTSVSPARSSFSLAATSLPPSLPPPVAQPQPQLSMPTTATTAVPADIWLTDSLQSTGLTPAGRQPSQQPDMPAQDGTSEPFWNGLLGQDPFQFGTTASSEYHMLDAMLNSMSPMFPSMGDGMDMNGNNGGTNANSGLLDFGNMSGNDPSQMSLQAFNNGTMQPGGMIFPQYNTGMGQAPMQPGMQPNFSPHSGATPNQALTGDVLVSPYWPPMGDDQNAAGADTNNPWANWANATTTPTANDVNSGIRKPKTSSEVYHNIVKPYDYTEGYHFLMEYLAKNFEQRDVLKVVRALAAFRPSLIALQMPMSEEDEIFLERSFQRTLIELEKLISYSATPTAVWRRTGEIVYANPEFCQLTGRTGSQLLGGKTYIYLLFSQQSIIGYWENFSVHAFENTTQNFFQTTSLIAGDGSTKTCSCCYTIRRDVFDLPSVIIGQFLPIIEA